MNIWFIRLFKVQVSLTTLTCFKNVTYLLKDTGNRVDRNTWYKNLLVLSFLLKWIHETQCVPDDRHFHFLIDKAGDVLKHARRELEGWGFCVTVSQHRPTISDSPSTGTVRLCFRIFKASLHSTLKMSISFYKSTKYMKREDSTTWFFFVFFFLIIKMIQARGRKLGNMEEVKKTKRTHIIPPLKPNSWYISFQSFLCILKLGGREKNISTVKCTIYLGDSSMSTWLNHIHRISISSSPEAN